MILFVAALSLLGISGALGQDRSDFFEKKICPVLAEHRYRCHSVDAARTGMPVRSCSSTAGGAAGRFLGARRRARGNPISR